MGNATLKEKKLNKANANNAMEYYLTTPNATSRIIKTKFNIRPRTDSNPALMNYLSYWGDDDLYEKFKQEKVIREWAKEHVVQEKTQYDTKHGDIIFGAKMAQSKGVFEDVKLSLKKGTQLAFDV